MAEVVNVVTPLTRAAVAARRSARENEMRERLKRRVAAVAVAVGLLGPLAAGAQGAWEAPAVGEGAKESRPARRECRRAGKQVAQLNCVACHGTGGKGDGAAAAALNPKPADWTSPAVQSRVGRRDLLEDLHWARRHAAVEAPARNRPLGHRPLHSLAQGEVARPRWTALGTRVEESYDFAARSRGATLAAPSVADPGLQESMG